MDVTATRTDVPGQIVTGWHGERNGRPTEQAIADHVTDQKKRSAEFSTEAAFSWTAGSFRASSFALG